MASSSSSSVRIGGCTYDVFLSFRGEDTRNNFVDHLHAALVRNGIRVFKDDVMLHKGNTISSDLLTAIEESRFAVVVFSINYANSSWCLDELTKIIECQNRKGHKILPVFYHVDPSDVRRQTGNFATAFQKHEEKFREEIHKVNKWRKALSAAANSSGWHILPDNRGESSFIAEIVHEINTNIQPRGMENNLIDIESRIDKLNSLLDTEATHEVRMIGICGMGGIGKTTIARALFRRISYKFDGSSFTKGVREKSKRDICVLQQQILKDVLATPHESNITDPDEGAELIKTRFENKKVLLVLDDVDDLKQLEFLAAEHEWFGSGSRVIITTRNEHLLSDANATYKPDLLLNQHAVKLFSTHAFRKDNPPEGYEELSNRVIRYTGGLPLALKVLGSFFRKKEVRLWESALNRLAETPNMEIFEILKVSFDGLEASEKQIFLDACLFKGHEEDHVTRVLDSFGFHPVIGIAALIEKSLITVSNGRIDMHDVLQEMGFHIIRQCYPNSRLWRSEEIRHLIKRNRNLDAVEVIVSTYNDEDLGFSADVFENMKNIRLLHISQDFTSCYPLTLPDELRWLRWNKYQFSSLPVTNMDNLVGLEMHGGKIEYLWRGNKFMPNLKFIHLEHLECIESSPDVSGAPNVERLILSHCINLVEVHKSLGTLKKLAYLNMSGCYKLKSLLSMIEMPLLETIDLSDCRSLESFPEVSSGMEKLSKIYLNGCSNLKIIPRSICNLKSLESLHLQDCDQLPEDMGSMKTLEELQLGFRDHIMAFQRRRPESVSFHTLTKLCYLRKLDLSWRPIEDTAFFNNLDGFSSLEELHLSGNWKLVQLPASISCLSRFKHLELNRCRKLQSIQGLPSGLQVLKASDCIALQKIEDLTKEYAWLHKIWLHGCERLIENQEIEGYLDNMLQQSFLKKCVARHHVLSIAIPGTKIPSWFEEQRLGNRIALKLPPKHHTDIMGFVVCGVFQVEWPKTIGTSEIHFGVGVNRTLIRESEVDYRDESAATVNESIWIVYIPFGFSQQETHDGFKREDWSLSITGDLIITSEFVDKNVVRCGARIMYKEDVESMQERCIPDYRPNSNIIRSFDDSFIYREKHV